MRTIYAGVDKSYVYVTKINTQSQEFVISRAAISGSNKLVFSPHAIYKLSGKHHYPAKAIMLSNKTQLYVHSGVMFCLLYPMLVFYLL